MRLNDAVSTPDALLRFRDRLRAFMSQPARNYRRSRKEELRRFNLLADSIGTLAGLRTYKEDAKSRSINRVTRRSEPLPHVMVLTLTRNEIFRIGRFLDHYRKLGVERFAVVDNGSTDGTFGFLREQDDVDLYTTDEPYSSSCFGAFWVQYLIEIYGPMRWFVIVDADEMLYFPDMDKKNLPDLCGDMYADQIYRGYTPIIDLYDELHPFDTKVSKLEDLDSGKYHFDSAGYQFEWQKIHHTFCGGPRERLYKMLGYGQKSSLNKYALSFDDGNLLVTNIHMPCPLYRNQSPQIGVLMHMKFIGDFAGTLNTKIQEAEHWKNSQEYKMYQEILESFGPRAFFWEGSEVFRGVQSLEKVGFFVSEASVGQEKRARPARESEDRPA
jgi:hypothetical protein